MYASGMRPVLGSGSRRFESYRFDMKNKCEWCLDYEDSLTLGINNRDGVEYMVCEDCVSDITTGMEWNKYDFTFKR